MMMIERERERERENKRTPDRKSYMKGLPDNIITDQV